jgi:hypothetical protein
MGWVLMSERELNRIEVLSRIDEGVLTVTSAAALLGLGQQGGRIASVTAWAGLGAFWKGQAGASPRACTGAPVRKVPQHTSPRLQLVASGERCGILLRDGHDIRPFPLSTLSPGFTRGVLMGVKSARNRNVYFTS